MPTCTHEDSPRDSAEQRPLQHRLEFGRPTTQADVPLTLSELVAGHARSHWGHPTAVPSLPTGVRPARTRELVPAAALRGCRRERLQLADVMLVLVSAMASVMHYRCATRSGVQVTSMPVGLAAPEVVESWSRSR